MEIHPRQGVGDLRIGMSDGEVLASAGTPEREFVKIPGGPTVFAFDGRGLHVHLDEERVAREFEVFRPARAVLAGKDLLGLDRESARIALSAAGCTPGDTDDGHEADDCGIRTWIQDGFVTTVVVHDPDAPMEVPSTNELLAQLGIAPLRP